MENLDEDAFLHASIYLLMSWIWVGSGLMVVGGIFTLLKEHLDQNE